MLLQRKKRGGRLTTQQKHPMCHSAPSAFTTVSVTGFRQPLHFVLYRFVWHPTHHAYPSFSTNGVEESNGSPHCAQKKCPACHSAPHATMTSPSMGVLHDLQRGENISWKSRWQKKRLASSKPSSSSRRAMSSGVGCVGRNSRSKPCCRARIRATRSACLFSGSG